MGYMLIIMKKKNTVSHRRYDTFFFDHTSGFLYILPSSIIIDDKNYSNQVYNKYKHSTEQPQNPGSYLSLLKLYLIIDQAVYYHSRY